MFAQCPPPVLTSLFPASPSSFRQNGFAVGLHFITPDEVIVISGDNFHGQSPLTFAGAAFITRGVRVGPDQFQWTQETLLRASSAAAFDQAGGAVAIAGLPEGGVLALSGAALDDAPLADAGSVAVFKRGIGGTWEQEATLLAPAPGAGDTFGSALATDGVRAAIAAPLDDTSAGANAGSVAVFARTAPGLWTLDGALTPPEPQAGETLGDSVAISGEWALAGAPGRDTAAGANAGAALLFRRAGDAPAAWQHVATLVAPDAAAADAFGASVALDESGAIAVVGAPAAGPGESGAAYAFTRSGEGPAAVWTFAQTLQLPPGDAAPGDQFGFSVAVAQGVIVVGAIKDDAPAPNTGSASVFDRDDAAPGAPWTLRSTVTRTQLANDDFGWSVATSRGLVIVGAPANDDFGLNWGNTLALPAPIAPVIIEAPDDQTLPARGPLALRVRAEGPGPLAYQWLRDGVPLLDTADIAGTTTPDLSLSAIAAGASGVYSARITGPCGERTVDAPIVVLAPECPGDATGDLQVSFADVTAVLANFGAARFPATGPGDADASGRVDFADITAALAAFGSACR
ncbi:MAG: hypothetical protein SFZ24_00810 [Planctomycetota bacterium]|nr:hypothetical protein [Planctomycetota bacterium]